MTFVESSSLLSLSGNLYGEMYYNIRMAMYKDCAKRRMHDFPYTDCVS